MAAFLSQSITSFAALSISVACLALCLVPSPPAAFMPALHPFFHAGLLHAVINVMPFLCVCFIFKPSPLWLLAAYITAVTAPSQILVSGLGLHTIGLSSIVYFLFGSIAFRVASPWRFQGWMSASIAVGFFLPMFNASLHLYCYIIGLASAAIVSPIIKRPRHG